MVQLVNTPQSRINEFVIVGDAGINFNATDGAIVTQDEFPDASIFDRAVLVGLDIFASLEPFKD
jgi:hypothetical protein